MPVVETKVIHANPIADNVTHLRIEVPHGLTWQTGQFARLALPCTSGEPIWRCYSIACKAGSPVLDFYIARVDGGAVSPKLGRLKPSERVLIDTEMNGMLLEEKFAAGGRILWMLSTGTGVAPFIAMISDEDITSKYEHLILVHGVRHWGETEYLRDVLTRSPKLQVMASVTREKGAAINVRIPEALESGLLEETAGLKMEPKLSRVMLCGNPAMIKSVRPQLKTRGFASPRGGEAGTLLAENFWL